MCFSNRNYVIIFNNCTTDNKKTLFTLHIIHFLYMSIVDYVQHQRDLFFIIIILLFTQNSLFLLDNIDAYDSFQHNDHSHPVLHFFFRFFRMKNDHTIKYFLESLYLCLFSAKLVKTTHTMRNEMVPRFNHGKRLHTVGNLIKENKLLFVERTQNCLSVPLYTLMLIRFICADIANIHL